MRQRCPPRPQLSTLPRHSRQGLRRARPPPQASAGPAQASDVGDRLRLEQLGELLSAGVLTQAEFEQQKACILNG